MEKASKTTPPGASRRKIQTLLVPVDLDPYLAWFRYELWKAVQSNCKADARLFKTVSLPVLSTQIFSKMMALLFGLSLSRLRPTAHPEARYSEAVGVRTWTVSIRDSERLAKMCDFAQAKADASVGTARPSRRGNYNAIIELELVQTHKLDPHTWSKREYLTMRVWMATMNKTGAVTVPPARYTAAEVAEIETYMQTLTVQAKAARKPVDASMHRALRRVAKAKKAARRRLAAATA